MLKLCTLEDLPFGRPRLLRAGASNLILIKALNGEVRCFLNRCPHLGIPLAWQDSQLTNPDGTLLQCSTHGALFKPDSGHCIQGPCQGDELWSFNCWVENSTIFVDENDLPGPHSAPL